MFNCPYNLAVCIDVRVNRISIRNHTDASDLLEADNIYLHYPADTFRWR